MEVIKSEETEEIGLVLSKEESEALAFALSRFTCHERDNVLSQLICTYLTDTAIDYTNKDLETKYRRWNKGFTTDVFSLSVWK